MARNLMIEAIQLCSLHSIYQDKEEDCTVSENKIKSTRKNKQTNKHFRITLNLKFKFVGIPPVENVQAYPLAVTPLEWAGQTFSTASICVSLLGYFWFPKRILSLAKQAHRAALPHECPSSLPLG